MPEATASPSAPPSCPSCGQATKQHQAGTNPSRTARRECRHCGRTYTPQPKPHGYDLALRRAALKMCVDGLNSRRIARHLSVNHQTVINWINAAAAGLPAPPPPSERRQEQAAGVLELDELYTFVSQNRSRCFSRCLWALARAVALFVCAWNRRQTFNRQFPKMPAHVCGFVADLI